jgi:hypothetical protein
MKGRNMKIHMAIGFVIAIAVVLPRSAWSSAEWNLRRNSSNGACSVQPVDSLPQLGEFLAKHPTRKAACEDAKARRTSQAGMSPVRSRPPAPLIQRLTFAKLLTAPIPLRSRVTIMLAPDKGLIGRRTSSVLSLIVSCLDELRREAIPQEGRLMKVTHGKKASCPAFLAISS